MPDSRPTPTSLEATTYVAEAALTAAFARYLHVHKNDLEPDWTWAEVMAGVILSSAPAILLARLAPSCWRRYEARVAAGFLLSAAIIVPWQLWLQAIRWGEERGYRWAIDDHQTTTLGREPRSAAPRGRDRRPLRG